MLARGATATAATSLAATSHGQPLTVADAVALVAKCYGLRACARRLAGEQDCNFRISAEQGNEFLLKVVHPAVDPAVTAMHTQALLHLARYAPDAPVQRVVPDLAGQPTCRFQDAAGAWRIARLVTYLPGCPQSQTMPTPLQRFNAGKMLATLQRALRDFHHPAEAHHMVWDLAHARSLSTMLAQSPDDALTDVLAGVLADFADTVLPHLPHLRAQVVHNDLNRDNLLVHPRQTDRIVGVLDFGDMVRTPILFDVAVGAAYQLGGTNDSTALLATACDFIAGFHARRALLAEEIDLLFITLLARLAMRVVITEWRAVRYPENRAYILRNTVAVRRQLACLATLSRAQATAQIIRAVSQQELTP